MSVLLAQTVRQTAMHSHAGLQSHRTCHCRKPAPQQWATLWLLPSQVDRIIQAQQNERLLGGHQRSLRHQPHLQRRVGGIQVGGCTATASSSWNAGMTHGSLAYAGQLVRTSEPTADSEYRSAVSSNWRLRAAMQPQTEVPIGGKDLRGQQGRPVQCSGPQLGRGATASVTSRAAARSQPVWPKERQLARSGSGYLQPYCCRLDSRSSTQKLLGAASAGSPAGALLEASDACGHAGVGEQQAHAATAAVLIIHQQVAGGEVLDHEARACRWAVGWWQTAAAECTAAQQPMPQTWQSAKRHQHAAASHGSAAQRSAAHHAQGRGSCTARPAVWPSRL